MSCKTTSKIYYLEMPLLKTTKTLNCSCSSKNTLLTLKDLSSIYWIYIRRQRPCIYVSVFVLKDQYYTKLTLIKRHFQIIYFRCLYQNPNYSCHRIVAFCVQYIYYILKRNGPQTRCNFHTDKPPLYFSTGIRIANILHARLRPKCSSLKCDLFRCNLITSVIE
jgi:hypothetical protein